MRAMTLIGRLLVQGLAQFAAADQALPMAAGKPSEPPRMYLAPERSPADVGLGDYITKWWMPIADLEERGRYAAANAALGPADTDRPRVIFLGDSITEGWKALESQRFSESPHRVINRGISGQLTLHMLLRLQVDVLHHRPKVLVLLAGTNDIRIGSNWMSRPTELQMQRLRDNLTSIVDAGRAQGVQVVLCTLPPVHDEAFDPTQFPVRSTVLRPAEAILEANEMIRRLAATRGLLLVDYHMALSDERGMMRREASNDGLHPNERGYALMQEVLTPLVQRALAVP
jgi:lysophospholipase L1-like esterase